MLLHHRNLVVKSGIDDAVRILLIWEYPARLAASDARPHTERMLHARSAVFIITNEPSQQPEVGGVYPVVIIKVERGEHAEEAGKRQVLETSSLGLINVWDVSKEM